MEIKNTNIKGVSRMKDNEKDIWQNETLKDVMKNIEKSFGKGAIMKLGEEENLKLGVISSGSFLIDQAIGIGGYPKGRIIEIYGPESSGKTTLGLHAIAEAQKLGGTAAFIDVEHSLDPNYAKNLGVDIKNILVSQPDSGEQALDILEMLVKSQAIDIVVLDSVAALVPKAELDGEMSDQSIGLQARLMSKALRKLNGIISKTNTVVIFINQLREKVGVIFGSPEITPGGRALRFYSSVRLEVRKGEQIITNGEHTANKVKIKVAKNKVSSPFKTALITINYNKGINRKAEIVELAGLYNVLEKSGVWYSYKGEKIGQGKNLVIEWMDNNPDKFKEIENELINKMNK
ncbi:recombinase RecA [[Acholeplasma] multilocale]|uniref:recombinase RecA n=1 Tax=[Acholeplasma] multilocale TaxID=264638 RepID=UPI000550D55B|nr:recombinase RecA [[Acholeplasma] multilocale]